MTRCLRFLALGILAVVLIAADAAPPARPAVVEPPTAESWEKLKAAHIDSLVAYVSAGGDNKSGSLELEMREQAIAFARRIDAKSPKLKNLFARKRPMTPDEQKADHDLRDQVSAREKSRLAEEAKDTGSKMPPQGEDVVATLENLRFVILRDQIVMAKQLSLDPDDQPTVVLRRAILMQVKIVIGPTKWAWEKRLKDHVEQLLNAKYEPWIGTWLCSGEWGELNLSQDGVTIKGTWKDGTLAGEMKGRSVVGKWTGQGTQHGGFTFTLGDNDLGFSARVTDKVDRPESWTAMRKGSEPEPTVIEVEEPAVDPKAPPAESPKPGN
ncbi:MAG TPA: hypothetical protein VHX44_03800 [Planctomycetota bacterium]|nr:hypothetical protein [Planctomycetota bacterium]